MPDRSRLVSQLRYSIRSPGFVTQYARRLTHGAWLWVTLAGHVAMYRAVMRSDATRDPDDAVGSSNRDRRSARPRCPYGPGTGSLRRLETARYQGIDISPDTLRAAQRAPVGFEFHDKPPRPALVRALSFDCVPDEHRNHPRVHAHTVFTRSPPAVIESCPAKAQRVLRPDGLLFDFTVNSTRGAEAKKAAGAARGPLLPFP
ncbi:hypothetical protein [Streptomyces sp. NPDC017993]|uniref:hypothetical protein n=1 Tax=Streptomyces sp. NPDC017993 TaxID=3365027 RepID=UPI0037B41197